MNIKNILKSIAIVSLASISVFFNSANAGDMAGAMSGMFNMQYANQTPGLNYQSQSMGVIAGPSVYARNRTSQINFYNFTPPSYKTSPCGGIDIYTGALSYIKAPELINALRTVASGAPSYAFHIAISSLCKDCAAKMREFFNDMKEFTSKSKDSCKLTQWAMDKSGASGAIESTFSSLGNKLGLNDTHGIESDPNKDPSTALYDYNQAAAKLKEGNIAYELITKSNVPSWFSPTVSSSDTSVVENMMSYTGSLIGKFTAGADGAMVFGKPVPMEASVGLQTLIHGGEVKVWKCEVASTVCIDPQLVTITMDGFDTYVRLMLLGDGANKGIVKKMSSKDPLDVMNNNEKQFLQWAPGSVGSQIRSLSVNPVSAEAYAKYVIDYLSVELAATYVEDLVRSVRVAMANNQNNENVKLLLKAYSEMLREKQTEVFAAINIQNNKLKNAETSMNVANLIRQNLYSTNMNLSNPFPNKPQSN